ncbi:MAG: polyphosphate kinase 2 family protein [Planctomycetaceae bacterium]
MPDTHQLIPGQVIRLSDMETDGKKLHDDRDAAEREFKELRKEFIDLQPVLYAEAKRKLLIVLQAMDAGGKDGTIRSIFEGVNPQGVQVTPFKRPSQEELDHDFLWRIHKAVPGRGMIGVFNRSHYEDVLVVRVDRIVPESVWRPRYQVINQFEQHLTASGTTILKFFLHISKSEQKQRFQERLDQPDKNWKFDLADLEKRKQWDEYQQAFEDMLKHCTTREAAWHVIPADQNWYRDLAIMRVIVNTLRGMNLQYPEPPDLRNVVIDG